MKTVHVGFEHHIAVDDIVALLDPDGTHIRKRIAELNRVGSVINLCRGRRAKCLIITKNAMWFLSALNPITIARRMADDNG